jgi:hypothetical protein
MLTHLVTTSTCLLGHGPEDLSQITSTSSADLNYKQATELLAISRNTVDSK